MLKPIRGFERYLISSNDGQIYSNAKGKTLYPLKLYIKSDGYLAVSLWGINVKGKKYRKTFLVHRLVAETFIPNFDNKPTVNHKDGVKTHNCVDNLEWATSREQNIHAFTTGLNYARKGEDANRAELKWEDVYFIRNNYPKISVKSLASQFKVCEPTIYAILYNRTWVDDNYKPSIKKHINKEAVIYIRQHPEIKGRDLALMFNTSPSTISEIRNNKIWKEI